MKSFKISILITALVMLFASSAMAAPCNGQMRPKVASFDFVVDYSGSMMMTHEELKKNKMELTKTVLQRVNDRIPELDYAAGMHTFAPVSKVLDMGRYSRASLAKSITSLKSNLEIFGRMTPMGDNLMALEPAFRTMPRNTAIILVSDGFKNLGMDPVEEAKAIYASNPNLIIHIISIADKSPDGVRGQKILDSIAALNPATVSVRGIDLLSNDAAVDQFVANVFYTCGEQAVVSDIVLRSVQFPFDSAVITEESAVILDEVAKMLKQSPRNIIVAGHTCSIGTEQYNQGLSERRAASVKAYLTKRGVPAASMTTIGYGKMKPKFDNSTEKGRILNRRVELNEKK